LWDKTDPRIIFISATASQTKREPIVVILEFIINKDGVFLKKHPDVSSSLRLAPCQILV
jgi:hypothetical protein